MSQYITLPSSDKSDKNNTSSSFLVRLPETLKLRRGAHAIGLADIIYPCSFENVQTHLDYTVHYEEDEHVYSLPSGNYITGEEIITGLEAGVVFREKMLDNVMKMTNQPLAQRKATRDVVFTYNTILKRIECDIRSKAVTRVVLSKGLAFFLGFEDKPITESTLALHPVDYANNLHSMYIYCDAVQYSIIGSEKGSLLACIPTPPPNDFGRMISRSFSPIRYVPVSSDNIDAIRIEILDEFGRPISFNYGSTIVQLHITTID
ncbi:unnamed protein product [Auanema sp. JU1783]|nr:unnamed protein product [Auanema sp. JU1783]